jgi:ParB family chromosome partitioning protein
MKIALDDIKTDIYDVREEHDDEHVQQIQESLKEDGQWNPIIVRPGENGNYELIAGHTRMKAAQNLGWDELEATVKNVDDVEAEQLALKTNLKRKGMSKLEEGRVVNNLMREHNLTQAGVSEKLGKSPNWVSDRVRVALNLKPEVKGLVEEGELSYNLARVVTIVDEERQLEFAKLLIEQDITTQADARELARRFDNDTFYTIGYEGRDFAEFLDLLTEYDIDVLVDVRESTTSNYKPEFNGEVLSNRLQDKDIEYRHVPELGVKSLIRKPYKKGAIGHGCFEDWYTWWVQEEADFDLEEFAYELEGQGAPAVMCIERHASPNHSQSIHCHRDHLADMIRGMETNGRVVFPDRVDIK